jgi:formylglycine-generating enzyme required for sulfatase activity
LTTDKEPRSSELPAQILSVQGVSGRIDRTDRTDRSDESDRAEGNAAALKPTGPGRAINERDGAELVWVPAGEFLRGSKKGEGAADERPQRKVYLDGFWVYKLPVTLTQYKAFCEKAGREMPPLAWGQGMRVDEKADEGSYPMLVNWHDAAAYAKWAGGALPTEAQWEKAARGTDGRVYPWGNAWDPERAVGMERTHYRHKAGMLPVGSSPKGASPYGVEDMAGNVWEWVADWYEYRYYERAPRSNPLGPEAGSHRVLRGGDSMWDERFARCAARMPMPPHVRDWVKTGFRVALPGSAAPVR